MKLHNFRLQQTVIHYLYCADGSSVLDVHFLRLLNVNLVLKSHGYGTATHLARREQLKCRHAWVTGHLAQNYLI